LEYVPNAGGVPLPGAIPPTYGKSISKHVLQHAKPISRISEVHDGPHRLQRMPSLPSGSSKA